MYPTTICSAIDQARIFSFLDMFWFNVLSVSAASLGPQHCAQKVFGHVVLGLSRCLLLLLWNCELCLFIVNFFLTFTECLCLIVKLYPDPLVASPLLFLQH